MNNKRFAKTFFFISTVFVLINAVVWQFYVRDILARKGGTITGDLARLGYVPDLAHARKNTTSLMRLHQESGEYHGQRVDMLTVGDSFSQGGGGGSNRYYQDHIATVLNLSVLNLKSLPGSRNELETVAMLANSGFLIKAGVRYVLVENTQRLAVKNLSLPFSAERSIGLDQLTATYGLGNGKTTDFNFSLPPVSFINDGNFRFLLYSALYHLDDCAFISVTCRGTLNAKRFSIGNGREMLFYKKDVRAIRHHDLNSIKKMNTNLNALATKLKSLGITLLFMPAVSKYDLYREDFVKDCYPLDPFFDLLREQERHYLLVDTKAVLRNGVTSGTLDIFYVDDTHWSSNASKLIAEEIKRLFTNSLNG